jgi:hypothetical protein
MGPDPDADTIVTLPEVAHLLKAADKTVYTIATRPKLMPCDLVDRLRVEPERADARFLGNFLTTAGRLHTEMTTRGTSNLNLPSLENRRKGLRSAMLEWWKSEKTRPGGGVPNEQLARERARRVGNAIRQRTPFDPVAVWWLDQRLARKQS